MARLTKDQLWDFFRDGDRPDENAFKDLIDECYNAEYQSVLVVRTYGVTPPINPLLYDYYINSSDNTLYQWDGILWSAKSGDLTMLYKTKDTALVYIYDGLYYKKLGGSDLVAGDRITITGNVISADNMYYDDTYVKSLISANTSAISSEIANRTSGDTVLQNAIDTEASARMIADSALTTQISGKQDTLVSGTNIKTINGVSLLGSGDTVIKCENNLYIGTQAEREAFSGMTTGTQWNETGGTEIKRYIYTGTAWEEIKGGNLLIGTEAERLAITNPVNGLQFNEINTSTSGATQYIYSNNMWKKIEGGEQTGETVIITFTSSDGLAVFSGSTVYVAITGESGNTYTIDSGNSVTFSVEMGKSYTIGYPVLSGYIHPRNDSYVASITYKNITKNYIALASTSRSAVLETQSTNLTVYGDEAIVDSILSYGSFVIDEVNKKYAKLSPTHHGYFDDGTVYTGTYGNCFRYLPEVHYLVDTNASNLPVIHISSTDLGGHSWPESWIGCYKGSVSGSLLSRPDVTTTQNMTMSAFWTAAQGNGGNYGLVNYDDHCKLLALHYTKFGKSNSDDTMGIGLRDAGSSYYTHQTGYCKALGDGTGEMTYASTSFKMNQLFGIEDLAGSTWEFRPNIRFENSGARAVVYTGNTVSNTALGRMFTKPNNFTSAYITKMVLGEYCDFIPSEAGTGSSSTFYCDGTWASTGGQLLVVGGSASDGPIAGLSAAHSCHAFSASDAVLGARLAFRGDISDYTLVTGSELASLH